MSSSPLATWMLGLEARSLLTRLEQVHPFALKMPMVPAAALAPAAQVAIEAHMSRARHHLGELVRGYLAWLETPAGRQAPAAEAQRRYALLKLRFNSMLDDFDIFADVITQRSEHEIGVWVSGLDVVAADALAMPGYYQAPPVVCYLDRGHGAAIRRARTRLPGGDENPVAVIRVPRERMVGSGIASSLVHEVGHQGAALLGLVESLRPELQSLQKRGGVEAGAWRLWERWISEILADFWSVARVGIGSTLGLIGVVSLPRFFVLRTDVEDPHPTPWIRVRLSAAMGQALYPHPQWERLARLWESYYPLEGAPASLRTLFTQLEATLPAFVRLLVGHRPPTLRGRSLPEAMQVERRQPARLRALWQEWRGLRERIRVAPPSLVFAVISQARADSLIGPEEECRVLSDLLTAWALDDSLQVQPRRAPGPPPRPGAAPEAAQRVSTRRVPIPAITAPAAHTARPRMQTQPI